MRSFREQDMWTQHVSTGWCMPIHIQWMLSWTSCIMYSVAVPCQIDRLPELFRCRWSWQPCSPDKNPCISLGSTSKIMFTAQPAHGPQIANRKKLLLKRSQVTCCMIQLAILWFIYSESRKLKDLILSMCSHKDHMHINSPWKWAFIQISYSSVP